MSRHYLNTPQILTLGDFIRDNVEYITSHPRKTFEHLAEWASHNLGFTISESSMKTQLQHHGIERYKTPPKPPSQNQKLLRSLEARVIAQGQDLTKLEDRVEGHGQLLENAAASIKFLLDEGKPTSI